MQKRFMRRAAGLDRLACCPSWLVDVTRAWLQGDNNEARTVFRFTPIVAPVKATVFPLLQKNELNEVARKVRQRRPADAFAVLGQQHHTCRLCCQDLELSYFSAVARVHVVQ
jgi:glycyl-tRNA synthetase (class II)